MKMAGYHSMNPRLTRVISSRCTLHEYSIHQRNR